MDRWNIELWNVLSYRIYRNLHLTIKEIHRHSRLFLLLQSSTRLSINCIAEMWQKTVQIHPPYFHIDAAFLLLLFLSLAVLCLQKIDFVYFRHVALPLDAIVWEWAFDSFYWCCNFSFRWVWISLLSLKWTSTWCYIRLQLSFCYQAAGGWNKLFYLYNIVKHNDNSTMLTLPIKKTVRARKRKKKNFMRFICGEKNWWEIS